MTSLLSACSADQRPFVLTCCLVVVVHHHLFFFEPAHFPDCYSTCFQTCSGFVHSLSLSFQQVTFVSHFMLSLSNKLPLHHISCCCSCQPTCPKVFGQAVLLCLRQSFTKFVSGSNWSLRHQHSKTVYHSENHYLSLFCGDVSPLPTPKHHLLLR